jgi:hypothetical protein
VLFVSLQKESIFLVKILIKIQKMVVLHQIEKPYKVTAALAAVKKSKNTAAKAAATGKKYGS